MERFCPVSANHSGHYETFLNGLVDTIWEHPEALFRDTKKLFCRRWKDFALFLSSSHLLRPISLFTRVDVGAVFWGLAPSFSPPPPVLTRPFGTLVDLYKYPESELLGHYKLFGTLTRLFLGHCWNFFVCPICQPFLRVARPVARAAENLSYDERKGDSAAQDGLGVCLLSPATRDTPQARLVLLRCLCSFPRLVH